MLRGPVHPEKKQHRIPEEGGPRMKNLFPAAQYAKGTTYGLSTLPFELYIGLYKP